MPEKSEEILDFAETLTIVEGDEPRPVRLYGCQTFDLGVPMGLSLIHILRQLQWGGWEIATHIHNERLCLKHEADSPGLLLSLYSQVWVAFDGPPEE